MDINKIIAKNLIRLRKEKNLSINKLAEISGVSKGILSQIEKQTTNPTINTIWKISSGLNVSYTELMSSKNEVTTVINKNQIVKQSSLDNSYRIFCFFKSSAQRSFELFQVELDSNKCYHSVGHSIIDNEKTAQEYLMVIQGKLELSVAKNKYQMQKDEAIFFDATKEHQYNNVGKETLIMVVMNYYQ